MSDTYLQVRTDPAEKEEAGRILEELGTNYSQVVNMLLKQIILKRTVPFDMDAQGNTDTVNGSSASCKKLLEELDDFQNSLGEDSGPNPLRMIARLKKEKPDLYRKLLQAGIL